MRRWSAMVLCAWLVGSSLLGVMLAVSSSSTAAFYLWYPGLRPANETLYLRPSSLLYHSTYWQNVEDINYIIYSEGGQEYTTGPWIEDHLGWHELEYAMSDPASSLAGGWYGIEVWISFFVATMNGVDTGIRAYVEYWVDGMESWESAGPFSYWTDVINSDCIYPHMWYGPVRLWNGVNITVNPATDKPFTWNDLASLQIRILLYYGHTDSVRVTVDRLAVRIFATTPPPPPPSGVQAILRPDGDIAQHGWIPYPDSPGTLWDKVDDTQYLSDNSTTYISAPGSANEALLTFSDPTFPSTTRGYSLTLWIVALSTADYAPDRRLNIRLYSSEHTDYTTIPMETIEASHTWRNYTIRFENSTSTNMPWTYDELRNLVIRFEAPNGEFQISQIGVYVQISKYMPTLPGEGAETSAKANAQWWAWVGTDGVMWIITLVGFVGMIAVPAYLAYLWKSGEGFEDVSTTGVWLWLLFFGLFIAGLGI